MVLIVPPKTTRYDRFGSIKRRLQSLTCIQFRSGGIAASFMRSRPATRVGPLQRVCAHNAAFHPTYSEMRRALQDVLDE